MDLNQLRESALGAKTSQLLQSGKLGAQVTSDAEKMLSLNPEDIADGVTQEKKDFLKKLRAISKNEEGTPIE